SNLDKNLRGTMRDMIREIQQEIGITTLFVTHGQEESMSMADRVAILFDGRVQQVDKSTELYENPNSREVAKFVGSSNIIDGTVKESNKDGQTIIQIGENNYLTSSQSSEKNDIKILIRPENIK